MLWDTFWLDTALPAAASPDDLLGVLDTDAALFAPLLPALFMADDATAVAANRSAAPRVWMPAGPADGKAALPPLPRRLLRVVTAHPWDVIYQGDALLLREPALNDVMGVDAMPIVMFVGTFPRFRATVASRAPGRSFESAWVTVPTLDVERHWPISPVNALFSYALAHEPWRYARSLPIRGSWAPPPNSKPGPAVPLLGSNRPPAGLVRLGCCRTYAMEGCEPHEMADASHITHTEGTHGMQWDADAANATADAAYAVIHAYLAALPDEQLAARRAACVKYSGARKRGRV
jgi:hypothetical protein